MGGAHSGFQKGAPEDVEKFTKAIAHEADTILAQRARAAGQIN